MIGERLKEERERLNLTIPVFAGLVSAGKNTVIDWQNEVSGPKALQLAAMASAGVDVLYLLTGRREGISKKLFEQIEQALEQHDISVGLDPKIAIYNRALESVRRGVDENRAAAEEVAHIAAALTDPTWRRTASEPPASGQTITGKHNVIAQGGSIAIGRIRDGATTPPSRKKK